MADFKFNSGGGSSKIRKKMLSFQGMIRDTFMLDSIKKKEHYNGENEENDYQDFLIVINFTSYPFVEEFKFETIEEREKAFEELQTRLIENGVTII
jgi:hypothetical protein